MILRSPPPQFGQCCMSMSNTRLSNRAHPTRCDRPWTGSAAQAAPAKTPGRPGRPGPSPGTDRSPYLAADAYLSFVLVNEAILKAKSADVAAVRAALSGLKVSTIVGDVEMRAADHQLLRPAVVVQAVKAGPGKGEIAVRSIKPIARATPQVSPECTM